MSIRFTSASSQYLEITSSVLSQNADYTVCGWFYFLSVTGVAEAIVHLNTGNADERNTDDFYLNTATSKLAIYAVNGDGSAGGGPDCTTTIVVNTWYFISMRRSGSVLDVRLGTLTGATASDGSYTMSTSGRSAATYFTFGAFRTGPASVKDYLNARVAQLKVYSTALSDSAIEAERLSVYQVATSNTYDYWKFQTAAGTTGSVNSRAWTVIGTPTTEADPFQSAPIYPATRRGGWPALITM
jgi:hypothetical protein